MKLALIVVLCHQLGNIPEPVCVTETIPDITIQNFLMAGKVGDEHQMPWTPQMCKLSAQNIVIGWLKDTPKYFNWQVAMTDCREGFEDPHKA